MIEKMGCDILFSQLNDGRDGSARLRGSCFANFTLLCDTILCNVCK